MVWKGLRRKQGDLSDEELSLMLWVTTGTGRGGMELAMMRIAHKIDPHAEIIIHPGNDRGRLQLIGSILSRAGSGEIVNSFGSSTALYVEGARLARVRRMYHIAWIRNVVQDWITGKRRVAIERALARADARIALSETINEQLRALGMDSTVVENWVDRCPSYPRASGDASYRGPLLWCARLAHAKCPGLAIAAHGVAKSDRDLVVLGEGRLLHRAKEIARQSPRAHKVHFVGYRRDAVPIRQQACMLVHASLFDGYPNTILESYAESLPVATSPAVGISEVVGGGVWGASARAQTVQSLACAVDSVLASRKEWSDASERSARGAEAHTWDNMAPKYRAVSSIWNGLR